MIHVGSRVKEIRKDRRMTQEELAKASGLSRPHIAMIETGGIGAPNSHTIASLARGLRVAAVDLLAPVGAPIGSEGAIARPDVSLPFEVIDFRKGLVEVAIEAEVALGEPMDYSVRGETVLVPDSFAPDASKHEFLIRGRGDSMIEYGIEDGDYVVVEARPGGVAASGELIIAWYEPADKAQPGGITLKRWVRRAGRKILQGSTPETTFELKEGDVFELKGIVRRSFKMRHHPKISG